MTGSEEGCHPSNGSEEVRDSLVEIVGYKETRYFKHVHKRQHQKQMVSDNLHLDQGSQTQMYTRAKF